MLRVIYLVIVSVLYFQWLACACYGYDYDTKYFEQQVDHFSYEHNFTFKQRYLVSTKFWKANGPIFFYTGNEGDIVVFANNTGMMWEVAPEFHAMVVFAEHRYYGDSMPFGNDSFKDLKHLGYLTSEQALADFSNLIFYIKTTTRGASLSPVVAFGGSYGGMLAAWFRMKYPHVVEGSLASSAPIWQFTGLTTCNSFYQVVTADFKNASNSCSESIRNSWGALHRVGSTDSGRGWLSKTFKLCSPLDSQDIYTLCNWLENTWTNLAMTDYPYPTDFLAPLPGYPVKATCKYLPQPTQPDEDLLSDIAKALTVYHNYTGQIECYNISQDPSSRVGVEGWNFQSCTEMVMPMCADGIQDMFEPRKWNFTAFAEACNKTYGVVPDEYTAMKKYGGKKIHAASNIIFSNGILDPWSSGGVLQSLSDSLIAIVMADAAHHLDLRTSNPEDPPAVVKGRQLEKKIIKKWISNAFRRQNSANFVK